MRRLVAAFLVLSLSATALATPTNVPITISGGSTATVPCLFNTMKPAGSTAVTFALDDSANVGSNVIYAISGGTDASRFVINGSELDVGATDLTATGSPVTYDVQVQTIPAVNFSVSCSP